MNRMPGWRISAEQVNLFWRLWNDACNAQGWHRLPSDQRDAKRKEILLDLGFRSAKHIDPTDGFDAVKDYLEQLADVLHNQPDDAGQRRRIAWRANEALERLVQAGCPQGIIDSILADGFKVFPGLRTVSELPTLGLLKLSVVLTARLRSWNRSRSAEKCPPPLRRDDGDKTSRTELRQAQQEFSPLTAQLQPRFFHG